MKWILLLLMLTVCCNAQTGAVKTGAAPSVTITEDMNGKTMSVHKSDDVVVTFIAPGGTGYEWEMESNKNATAKEEDVELNPGLPGGPLKRMYHVQLKKTGTVTLHFKFFRAWEKDTPPAKTFSVTLKVSE